MERKGSGFGKILSGYEFQKNYDKNKKPSFRSDRYQFTVVMPNLNYRLNGAAFDDIVGTSDAKSGANGAKVGANNEKVVNQLVEILSNDSGITQTELAQQLSVSRRTVQRIIKELTNENKIVRVGSARAGHWKVIK